MSLYYSLCQFMAFKFNRLCRVMFPYVFPHFSWDGWDVGWIHLAHDRVHWQILMSVGGMSSCSPNTLKDFFNSKY
jgi:hypothetical protein